MKKILKGLLAITMIFVFAIALTGCGKEEANNSGNPTGGNNNEQEQLDNTSTNLTTVDGWLTYWGLTVNDLKPANFTRLDKTSYNIETGVISEVGAYVNKKLTDEEMRDWIEKILAKLESFSENGKLENNLEKDKEITADYIMNKTIHVASVSFKYKGKKTTAMIAIYPSYLDNDDPDDAMSACSIKLSH